MSPKPIAALVFDFDGTIIDTETPVFESWRQTFVRAGVEPVDAEVWSSQVGMADGDAMDVRALLREGLGVAEVPDELETFRRNLIEEMLHAEQVRDGVVDFLDLAEAFGVRLAIGSSSPTTWVDANLRRVGLRDRFEVLSCADPGIPGKPDPTVYVEACRALGADPSASLAIEDSRNGVTAAVAAGMSCIAAPGPMTVGADLSHATVVVESLANLDAADWLTR